ncbi:endonuclease domain-containing 1 protein [Xenopus laevis]|uniref:Uncharacterized protein n=2 Tax=Xenopus laevis TaxID=8355 RepID=A0A974DDY9_XENLA|nr:endonuclease domain-containing 1 protein [Xenopus laevis]OCT90239.1 hypothetical protein XELAEV_18018852mg [Xenopus laevis]
MKMMLSLCWLFIAIVHKVEPLLSDNFSNCKDPFYKGQLPQGFNHIALPHHFNASDLPDGIKENELTSPAYICQQYGNNVHFASLYDRGRRIPLYSAYILDKRSTSKSANNRPGFFNVEPQLVYRGVEGTMLRELDTVKKISKYNKEHGISEKKVKNRSSYLISTSQAIDDDYKGSGYERGHVNPNGHHAGDKEQHATFTLTNVVPMTTKLNTDIWNKYEIKMIGYADGCTTMYVVTGIVPGNNWIKRMNTDSVNIPSYVWNAYCCVDNNGKPIKSGAGLRENDNLNTTVNEIGITDLQVQLKNSLGNIEIFQNNCA